MLHIVAGRAASSSNLFAIPFSILFASGTSAGTPEFLSDEDDNPIYAHATLRGSAGAAGALSKSSADERDRARCLRFLESLAPRFASGNSGDAFRIIGMDREATRTHFRIRRLEGGIPVFGGEGRAILDDKGEDLDARYMGRFRWDTGVSTSPALPPLPALPSIGAAEALDRARKHLARATLVAPVDPDYPNEPSPLENRPELVWLPRNSRAAAAPLRRLAWHLAVRPNFLELWELLVDAEDGSILLRFPVHCAVGPAIAEAPDLRGIPRTFGTYLVSDSRYYLIDASRTMFDPLRSTFPDQTVGALVTLDLADSRPSSPIYRHLTSADNAWRNPTAVSAHWHASLAYDYFLRVHGRNSINGMGGTVRSFINVAGPDGLAMDNAYWNGNSMFYGNGGTLMTPLAGSLDVSGHELTHGVVGATAGLRYRGQSGAINESMADIFGAMMDRDDWRIGEDVVRKASFASGAMRDMANPGQGLMKGAIGWQPGHMAEYLNLPFTQAGDFGGVHGNSGIPNRAFFLFATRVGKEKAEQVYYRALTRYLNASSLFVDLRLAVSLSAQDLYGEAEAKAAGDAFAEVGIGAPGSSIPKSDILPVNAGPQAVLLTRAGPGDGNTLYLADSAFAQARPLSRTPLRSRPSVSDDGSLALFVSGDGRLVKVLTDPVDPRETEVDGNPVWAAAAISRDGRRWAATRAARDTAIYVGDFAGGATRRFPLYRPTGLGVRTAVYAGSLDWDHAGGQVLFDVFHRIRGTDGSSMEYWDVGLLQAWDPQAGRFGDGQIVKPFGDLPDGCSAGNPVFAENSPTVVAYEFTGPDGAVSIMARDIETRRTGLIIGNSMIGHPGYDTRDAGVAYTSRNGEDTVISWIPINPDKISASGHPVTVAAGFKWPVPFARGRRPEAPTEAAAAIPAVHPRLEARYQAATRSLALVWVLPGLPAEARIRLSMYGVDGRLQAALALNRSAGTHRLLWPLPGGRTAPGLRIVRLEAGSLVLRARVFAGD